MKQTTAHARFLFEHDGLSQLLAGFFNEVERRGAPTAVAGLTEEGCEKVGEFIHKLRQSSQHLSVNVTSTMDHELDELEDLIAGHIWHLGTLPAASA